MNLADEMTNAVKINTAPNHNGNHESSIIRRFLSNVAKFTVDYTVNNPFKGLNGVTQLYYRIVQERFKEPLIPCPLNEKNNGGDTKLGVDLRNQMLEDLNEVQIMQKKKASAERVEGTGHGKKVPDEGIWVSDFEGTEKRRIFIRSRL